MAIDDDKALIRRFYEDWFPAGNLEPLLACVSDEFTNHATPPGAPQGKENIEAVTNMLQQAFSEQRYEIHNLVGDGDRVVVHCTWHATHTGDFMGIPPTRRSFAAEQVHIFRITSGQIAEHWAVRDDLSMLRQMGIAPG